MKKDLLNAIIGNLKQDVIDVNAGDTVTAKFENNGMTCHILAAGGGYFVIFDSTNDRMVVAWSLRLDKDATTDKVKGSWGNGYYFDNNGGNDIIDRYELPQVADLFIKKAYDLE